MPVQVIKIPAQKTEKPVLSILLQCVILTGGTTICHIWAIQVSAAVKGMVFKQFTVG